MGSSGGGGGGGATTGYFTRFANGGRGPGPAIPAPPMQNAPYGLGARLGSSRRGDMSGTLITGPMGLVDEPDTTGSKALLGV